MNAKSIKESINANSILSKVETIVGKTKIKHPKAEIIELDGTKYIYYSYFDRGFDDDGLDRVWDKCSDLKGVVDVGFGYGYGLENTKYENSLLIELDDDVVVVESKKSARKSMKEFNEDINNTAYFDRVAGELHSWYVCYVEDYERKYEYGFKNEKECINWIKKNGFDLDPSMIESKKSARKSIKEAKVMSYDEFKKIVKKEFTKDEIEGFGKTDNGYGVYVIAYGEKEIEIMCDDLRQYGFECKWWHSSDPEDDEPIYFIEAIPIMNESKNMQIKESRGQTVAELLQNASIKTIVYIYSDSTGDEFEGTNDQLKGEFSRFLYYTVSVWNIGNDKIVNIYCY